MEKIISKRQWGGGQIIKAISNGVSLKKIDFKSAKINAFPQTNSIKRGITPLSQSSQDQKKQNQESHSKHFSNHTNRTKALIAFGLASLLTNFAYADPINADELFANDPVVLESNTIIGSKETDESRWNVTNNDPTTKASQNITLNNDAILKINARNDGNYGYLFAGVDTDANRDKKTLLWEGGTIEADFKKAGYGGVNHSRGGIFAFGDATFKITSNLNFNYIDESGDMSNSDARFNAALISAIAARQLGKIELLGKEIKISINQFADGTPDKRNWGLGGFALYATNSGSILINTHPNDEFSINDPEAIVQITGNISTSGKDDVGNTYKRGKIYANFTGKDSFLKGNVYAGRFDSGNDYSLLSLQFFDGAKMSGNIILAGDEKQSKSSFVFANGSTLDGEIRDLGTGSHQIFFDNTTFKGSIKRNADNIKGIVSQSDYPRDDGIRVSSKPSHTEIILQRGSQWIATEQSQVNTLVLINSEATFSHHSGESTIHALTLSGNTHLTLEQGSSLKASHLALDPNTNATKNNTTLNITTYVSNDPIKLGTKKQAHTQDQIISDAKLSVLYQEGENPLDFIGKNLVIVAHHNGASNHPNATEGEKQREVIKNGIVGFELAESTQGFEIFSANIGAKNTDENGSGDSGDFTTYYIAQSSSRLNSEGLALSLSIPISMFDLYLANFNSLNKRMGELRDNPHSQGAWGRIFHGKQQNQFINSNMAFVTVQAGYDYAFALREEASNYLGFALSYSFSHSNLDSIHQRSKSSLIEGAIYNSYIEDSGWFNDTILKFGYLMNEFLGNTVSFKNKGSFALNLSNEFGYRIKLGQDGWSLDPQAEMGVGYISGNEFNASEINAFGIEFDSLFVLRSRLGASAGYDFSNLTPKDLKARIYLGIFGEMDFFKGRENIKAKGIATYNLSSNLTSDTRAVINLGTNLEVKENTRIYVDFESSFGGKIHTDYKINAGVRYSFGEKLDFSDLNNIQPIKDRATPIKLKEGNELKGENKSNQEGESK